MNPVAAPGFGAIQRRQKAAFTIHGEGTGIGFIAVYRIKVTLVPTQQEVRRIDQVVYVLNMAPGAGFRIYPVNVNTVTARVAFHSCITADIGERRSSHTILLLRFRGLSRLRRV